MTDSDSELMLRFRDGDDDAFRQLATRYQRPLVNFFYRLTRDRFTSEDYCQEVFARIIRAKARYKRMAKFRTWMYRIAKNYWIDRCRERAAAPIMGSLSTPIGGDEGGTRTLTDTVEGESPRPADEMRRKEIGSAIMSAVSRPPEEQRERVPSRESAHFFPLGSLQPSFADRAMHEFAPNYIPPKSGACMGDAKRLFRGSIETVGRREGKTR